MIYTLQISYWLTLPIALLAGGFLTRIFIFFHDCGHQSFFPSRKANRIVGFFLGLFALTPSETGGGRMPSTTKPTAILINEELETWKP